MSFRSSSSASASVSSSKRSGSRSTGGRDPKRKKSPFTDFGSYMADKNRKLRDQFEAVASTSSLGSGGEAKGIFHGVSIFVDGFTVPPSQELKGYMLKHGGRFENYFSRHRVTHIICTNLPDSKMKNFRAFSRGLPVVKPEWILDSLVANKLLNWAPYQLSELVKESGKQQKLSAFFTLKSTPSSKGSETADDPPFKLGAQEKNKQTMLPEEGQSSSYRKQDLDGSAFLGHERFCEEEIAELEFTDLEDEQSVIVASPHRILNMDTGSCDEDINSRNTSGPKFLGASKQHPSMIRDPNFVENYFKNSRLHFIGTWRNRYRKRFSNATSGNRPCDANLQSVSASVKACVMHIDMDCFFVSVVIRNYPDLLNMPVAVCHSDNPKGTAEISSANYPARDYGVKAGMFVRDAKACCPQLVIVPYDFEAYEEVADQFYSILHKHCNKVQALSCDEAFLDVTECANNDPVHLALVIRKEIAETTRCTASAGIAGNMLLARLATRSAKPNGQCFIPSEKVDDYLKDLPIKALPGIGNALGEKLKSRQIHTCDQLRMIAKEALLKDFGAKTGDMLWNYCRGIDSRTVDGLQEMKTVGAEVNWGVRFNNTVDCQLFLVNLCKEVSFRLQECGVQGRTITLKVKRKKKGAQEPAKFMGCGDCENMSRSITVPVATDNTMLLQRLTKQIFSSFCVDAKDVRGVGLQISKLENVELGQGRESTLESWLSSVKTGVHGKVTTSSVNPGHCGESYPELKPQHGSSCCGVQQEGNSGHCHSEALAFGPAHINASTNSHENRISVLPPMCELDEDVIKNLPPEIFSEMNDLYNGKLHEFMKTYEDKDGKTKGNLCALSPPEGKNNILLSGYKEIGGSSERNMTARRTTSTETYPETRNKGKQPLSASLSIQDLPTQSEAFADEHQTDKYSIPNVRTSAVFDDGEKSEQVPSIKAAVSERLDSQRAETFGKDTTSSLRKCSISGEAQYSDKPKIDLWLGNPPKWVELFKISGCTVLNIIAELYANSGTSCKLSAILHSAISFCPLHSDSNGEGWDDALSSLCELVVQYVGLKIKSDIEELYLCFRLLKRFGSTSKLFLQLYNIILPTLQASVNENYGGQLQLSPAG